MEIALIVIAVGRMVELIVGVMMEAIVGHVAVVVDHLQHLDLLVLHQLESRNIVRTHQQISKKRLKDLTAMCSGQTVDGPSQAKDE
jgi:hypothetical protein